MSDEQTVYVLEETTTNDSVVTGVFTDKDEMHEFKDDAQPDWDSRRDPIDWRWSEHVVDKRAGGDSIE